MTKFSCKDFILLRKIYLDLQRYFNGIQKNRTKQYSTTSIIFKAILVHHINTVCRLCELNLSLVTHSVYYSKSCKRHQRWFKISFTTLLNTFQVHSQQCVSKSMPIQLNLQVGLWIHALFLSMKIMCILHVLRIQ